MVSWLYFSGLDNCGRNNILQPFGFSKQFGSFTYDCDIFSDKSEREVRGYEEVNNSTKSKDAQEMV